MANASFGLFLNRTGVQGDFVRRLQGNRHFHELWGGYSRTEEHLYAAMQRLVQFDAVLLTERLGETIRTVQCSLGWQHADLDGALYKGSGRGAKEGVGGRDSAADWQRHPALRDDPEAADALERLIAPDLRLYELAIVLTEMQAEGYRVEGIEPMARGACEAGDCAACACSRWVVTSYPRSDAECKGTTAEKAIQAYAQPEPPPPAVASRPPPLPAAGLLREMRARKELANDER